ncbi:unnamed protein product [Closterium sp. NIES-53]
MLLHMGVQHHWWHLSLRQVVWVCNCLERSMTLPGTTQYQLLTGKKPDLMLARVWGNMVQFMVPEQQRGGKPAPNVRWGLHLGVLLESKGWEVLDLTDNKVVTSVEVIFYKTLSLECHRRRPTRPQACRQGREAVDERGVADLGAGRTGRSSKGAVDSGAADGAVDRGAVEVNRSDVVEVPIETPELRSLEPELRRSRRTRRKPKWLSYHAYLPPAAFTAVYDDADDDLVYNNTEDDVDLPKLDPDFNADPEHRWDIAMMTMRRRWRAGRARR